MAALAEQNSTLVLLIFESSVDLSQAKFQGATEPWFKELHLGGGKKEMYCKVMSSISHLIQITYSNSYTVDLSIVTFEKMYGISTRVLNMLYAREWDCRIIKNFTSNIENNVTYVTTLKVLLSNDLIFACFFLKSSKCNSIIDNAQCLANIQGSIFSIKKSKIKKRWVMICTVHEIKLVWLITFFFFVVI